MSVILPAEGDGRIGDCEQSVVGDRDAVSIAREIVQYMFGSAERRLAYTTHSCRNSERRNAANSTSLFKGAHGPKSTSWCLR